VTNAITLPINNNFGSDMSHTVLHIINLVISCLKILKEIYSPICF
jgi:hypothetical protein